MFVELDLSARAGEVLDAEIVVPPNAGRWAAVRLFAAATFYAIFDDQGDSPSTPTLDGFLVVTRRDTGETMLQVDLSLRPAVDEPDIDYLGYVRRQFDELTVGEFLDKWGVAA